VTGGLEDPSLRRFAEEAWARHLGSDNDLRSLRGRLTEGGSLSQAFHATALRRPDLPALEIDGEAVTHGELDERVGRLAGTLRAEGVRLGETVVLCAPSSMSMVVAYLAALRAGARVVLTNPTSTERELAHIVRDSGASFALAAGDALAALAGVPHLLDVAALGNAAAEPLAPEPLTSDAVALLAYTSGTTGKPKAVPLTHGNLLSSIRSAMLAWRWSEDDVLTHALPLFHQHGLGGVHATLIAGSRAVIFGRLDPDELFATIAARRSTILFAVPAVYERLVGRLDEAEPQDLTSLRLLICGSAPLSPALSTRIEQAFGVPPLERYGLTESGLDISNLYDGPRWPGAVGYPLPGLEVAVAADGRPVAAGEDGEILMRGPQVFSGYVGNDEANAAAFHPGGWFRTGDIGRIDPEHGYLRITGRLKDLIITGGMNVYPREVELVLEESPDVARAAVVGVPSERWGEEVVAAVVSAGPPVDEGALIEFARERLAPYKCPKRIQTVDELPTNAVGKVVASEVVRLLTA
jgi:malonyl-CoA/methylmalonyl-CoA synthetase